VIGWGWEGGGVGVVGGFLVVVGGVWGGGGGVGWQTSEPKKRVGVGCVFFFLGENNVPDSYSAMGP